MAVFVSFVIETVWAHPKFLDLHPWEVTLIVFLLIERSPRFFPE